MARAEEAGWIMKRYYVAVVNIPGYLPESDTPIFDTAREAWDWLAVVRMESEEHAFDECDAETPYSDTFRALTRCADEALWVDNVPASVLGLESDGTGSMRGDTPGRSGEYDLGTAYSVQAVSEAEAAEIGALQN